MRIYKHAKLTRNRLVAFVFKQPRRNNGRVVGRVFEIHREPVAVMLLHRLMVLLLIMLLMLLLLLLLVMMENQAGRLGYDRRCRYRLVDRDSELGDLIRDFVANHRVRLVGYGLRGGDVSHDPGGAVRRRVEPVRNTRVSPSRAGEVGDGVPVQITGGYGVNGGGGVGVHIARSQARRRGVDVGGVRP